MVKSYRSDFWQDFHWYWSWNIWCKFFCVNSHLFGNVIRPLFGVYLEKEVQLAFAQRVYGPLYDANPIRNWHLQNFPSWEKTIKNFFGTFFSVTRTTALMPRLVRKAVVTLNTEPNIGKKIEISSMQFFSKYFSICLLSYFSKSAECLWEYLVYNTNTYNHNLQLTWILVTKVSLKFPAVLYNGPVCIMNHSFFNDLGTVACSDTLDLRLKETNLDHLCERKKTWL